eukprot:CAMPEP_0206587874 /NCGR_PEP_ID=MMETSP0325_2-20121206/37923_1 /ASSEMBLY_ACC=CAM_ASM_000347 /TAXON_ID=2866 /ORGANISM="Crypthecodinium cohnii, Strain Seligo" /LENGTH=127 /DNA_ID=CAMNT_0054095997 /DNA_START=433 /DNA_END=813 /DNA_ORIENTATION=+
MTSPSSVFQSYCILHPESAVSDENFAYDDTSLAFKATEEHAHDTALFNKVFAPRTDQAIVYQDVGDAAVAEAIDQWRSTLVLAFGSSGSGKTFAVTGGAKRFSDRGLIPRSLSGIFEALAVKPDKEE